MRFQDKQPYDDVGRLSAANGVYGAYGYAYDLSGNRIAQSRPAGNDAYSIALSSNRLTQITGSTTRSFTYDAAGHAANDNRGPGANYSYAYDAAGGMAQADRDGLTLARYTSDARHLRVVRDLPGAGVPKTHYLYDASGNLLAEHDGVSGAVLREVIWLDDLPLAWVDAAAAGAPLYTVHADHLGTPQKLTDAAGAIVWDGVFAPFGETHAITGTLAQNLRFPGQYADSESALSYNWHRHYDPSLGRYLQSDPIGLAGGINTYAYVEGNPLRYTDPEGLIIDTIADLGFIGYDIYRLLQDGACNLSDNLTALGLDAAGAIIPGVTGLGAASRAAKLSKIEKSLKTEQIGKYTKTIETRPGKGPGQSRSEYVRYKNDRGETIRTYKDSYDRAGNFQGRKPLRGGPEGRAP